jgi:hypothetical protein
LSVQYPFHNTIYFFLKHFCYHYRVYIHMFYPTCYSIGFVIWPIIPFHTWVLIILNASIELL